MQAKRPNSNEWEEAERIDNPFCGRYSIVIGKEIFYEYECEIKIPITIFSGSFIPRKI